jgi:aminopeptidase N
MVRFAALFLSAAFHLIPAPSAAQRLPDNASPEHYSLWFEPNLSEETFRGRATIAVQLKQPATSITLHAAEIVFGDVTITALGRTQQARVTLDAGGETATLTVAEPIPAGPATIRIAYTGVLNDKLRGFYISTANGRKYAVTQMEATDARRAFPSFDEPIYKATFEISMTVDAGDTAISNGAQISDTPGPEPGKHTVAFAPTKKMSTYLVAMIVGDFVCRAGMSDGTPIRVCSTPDKQGLTGFALEAAEQQLRYYNEYFGIKYPFGKLDIVAVPDFAAGAMENTGAITFRERLLLIDPDQSSVDVRRNVASIISHEIAHQWFGNLVTMKWWDDIWLNEGFATWVSSKPIMDWRPDWRMQLADAEGTQSALSLDALRSTRPIRTKVETNEEINEVFDAIAYEKTAAVLRMIEGFVGPDAFRKAVASYLTTFAYANAAGQDFWTEVTRVTGRPVDRIMSSYVDQAGAPVLTVRNRCVGGATDIAVSQERFVGSAAAPAPAAAASSAQRWTLPACFKANDGPRCELVDRREQIFQAQGCENVFANAEARGYYFSEYSPDAVRALARSAPGLDPVERLSLLGDEWWMVRAARHEIGLYLDLAAAMSGDDTPAVLDAIASRLAYTNAHLADGAEQPRFRTWIRDRFSPQLAALGLPGGRSDPDDRHSRRATLLMLVGVSGDDAGTQRRARVLAAEYLKDASAIPPTLAPTVLQVAAYAGDAALYDQYVARLGSLSDEPEEYYRFFRALTWFRDPSLVRRTLEFAVSPAVRTQDTASLIGGLMRQPWSRDAAWAFTKAQWRALTQKLGVFQGIPGLVAATDGFCSVEGANDVRRFFAANPVPGAERTLQQSLERIANCAALDARQSAALSEWLKAR